MSTTRLWCALLVLTLGGVACHPRPPAARPFECHAIAVGGPRPTAGAAPTAADGGSESLRAPLARPNCSGGNRSRDLNAEHPLGDAFFDYNQNVLRDDAKQALQQDARWLAKWPETRIQIDGHCDERGTAEYNLALGERRAQVVKEYLTDLGIGAGPDADTQSWEGGALLPGHRGIVLVAEPTRPLRDHARSRMSNGITRRERRWRFIALTSNYRLDILAQP